MYANAHVEQMNREELQALQLERLQRVVKWAYSKSHFYQQSFQKAGVKPEDIRELGDIQKFPFLTAAALHRIDALDILTTPLSSVLRFNHMMEVTGEVTKLYTNGDIGHNVDMMTRCLVAAEVTNASVVGLQGELSDSRALDVQYALEHIGATVVPFGSDYRHWLRLMEIVGMDTLISTPQLIMQLIIQLQATGKNIIDYPITKVICLNTTNIQNPLQQHIQERTRTKVYNFYAPPEIGTAGMLYQCEEHSGQHVQEDFFYVEILKFDSAEPIFEDDRMGELVVTTLAAEAMPLIRYRTGQAVRRMGDSCQCGRTLIRVATPFTFF